MRRLALVSILAVGSLAAGCSQVSQFAGEAVGVPVERICATFDDAYDQYQGLLERGDATEQQVQAARDGLVGTLEDLADDVGGQVGEMIRSNASRLAEANNLQSPESIEAIEQARESLTTFCG